MPAYEATVFMPPAPVARVTLRNPQTGSMLPDVSMLIDSGADVTLIPQSAASLIGVVGSGESYELLGFDGSASVAHAVRVDFSLLKKTFKGRLLLIDQAWGILGRDILNHLSIVLDGPRLNWTEAPKGNP